MKIVYIIPFFKRLDLTEICFSQIKQHNRPVYVAGSEGEQSRIIAEKNGMIYLECANYPVSNKHNKLISMLKGVDYNYAIILGSDNFVSSNFTEKIEQVLEENKPDFLQLRGLYFYNQKTKKTTYFSGFTGVGRCYSRKALEALNYKLWDSGLNKGLDRSSFRRLISKGFELFEVDMRKLGVEVVDVKYAENITNHIVTLKGKPVNKLSIDFSEIDKLTGYNNKKIHSRSYLNTRPKVKTVDVSTGRVKKLNISVANALIKKKTYKKLDESDRQ